MPGFERIEESFQQAPQFWQEALEVPLEATFPEPFAGLEHFDRLLLLRCVGPERAFSEALQRWALGILGVAKESAEQGGATTTEVLMSALAATTPRSPWVVVILGPGADPFFGLPQLAARQFRELRIVCMGRGQGVHAKAVVADASKAGRWVFLQNSHLDPAWLSELDMARSQAHHQEFRLWLSVPHDAHLPAAVLASSVKVASEAPRGIK
ncbi:unnamed protein product, partial [Polarella glacialis]